MFIDELNFTMEDVKRAAEKYNTEADPTERIEQIMKSIQTPKKVKMDPELEKYLEGFANKALALSAIADLSPQAIIAHTLLVGLQLGVKIEQTKPEHTKTLHFRVKSD